MKNALSGSRSLPWTIAALVAFLLLATAVVLAQEETTEELPKGVGPIESVELGPIDEELAEAGEALFTQFCTACHKIEERYIGPALLAVTERRAPEWIMNMILNPDVMILEDETAYNLFAEYLTPMANQSLTEEQARAILEYFRTVDAAAEEGEEGTEGGEAEGD